MTDVLLYWRDYKKNWSEQFAGWHSKAKLFADLEPGDHQRLFLRERAEPEQRAVAAERLLVAPDAHESPRLDGQRGPSFPKRLHRLQCRAIVAVAQEHSAGQSRRSPS